MRLCPLTSGGTACSSGLLGDVNFDYLIKVLLSFLYCVVAVFLPCV